ncbi:hypothetical protein KW785_00155 [Candidatus Parcubacteria bacterium]|nr:hypothetical protein [Candidatus Parcubacteria bacterium]
MNNLLALANRVWDPLIVCGAKEAGDANHECGFADVIHLIKVVINDITVLATLLTVVACVMIGFILITSNGKPGALDKAKSMAGSVLTGYVIILVAWVVVYTITSTLLYSDYSLVR